eukprot:15329997-Ditylum_brightwellii.AAC.1
MTESPIDAAVMTQYHVSKGLKVVGKYGIAAVNKELRELVICNVMDPLDPDKMKWKDKKEVLQYIMFLTRNNAGELKVEGALTVQNNIKILTIMMPVPQQF